MDKGIQRHSQHFKVIVLLSMSSNELSVVHINFSSNKTMSFNVNPSRAAAETHVKAFNGSKLCVRKK